MVVPVMRSAQGDREFVADLAPHRARLSEPQMVRCNELEVRFYRDADAAR